MSRNHQPRHRPPFNDRCRPATLRRMRLRWVSRFARHPSGLTGALLLLALAVPCFMSLNHTRHSMRRQQLAHASQPPSWAHPFGTDDLGRDLLARLLYGGAISLTLGVAAAAVAVAIGTGYGAVAGYLGGRVDAVLMRIVDVLFALPYMLLVMLLTVSLGAWLREATALGSEWSRFVVLALAIGGVSWLTVARVVRGEVLALRARAFIEAARATGAPTHRIIVRHILPNLAGTIAVFGTLAVPQAILQESFLSFLGVGIQAPQATWGSLVAEGVQALNPIRVDWWRIVFPGSALTLTLLGISLVGDAFRDLQGITDGEDLSLADDTRG